MARVSLSEIIGIGPIQADGSRWIRERHTVSDGRSPYFVDYQAPENADIDAILAIRAQRYNDFLAQEVLNVSQADLAALPLSKKKIMLLVPSSEWSAFKHSVIPDVEKIYDMFQSLPSFNKFDVEFLWAMNVLKDNLVISQATYDAIMAA